MQVGNIKIRGYANYANDNYGVHAQRVDIGELSLWFSYNTVVAFCEPGKLPRVSVNVWGTTTGKHINAIDGGNKKDRIPDVQFTNELQDVLKRHGLVTVND
jgi:hypothetical protein